MKGMCVVRNRGMRYKKCREKESEYFRDEVFEKFCESVKYG